MSQNKGNESDSDYKIYVNPEVAFTIIYEDYFWKLVFSVEFGSDPKTVFLNKVPSEKGGLVDMGNDVKKAHVALAIERIEAHFKTQGLSVELE